MAVAKNNKDKVVKTVVYRVGELIYRTGFVGYHRDPNSLFADSYDMEREMHEVNALLASGRNTPSDLKRIEEFENRQNHLKLSVRHKAGITKVRGVNLNDFNIVVRDEESLDLPGFGKLTDIERNTIEIHTKDAGRAYIGVPRESNGHNGYPGVKQGINALAVIWSMSEKDNPYVDAALVEIEASIERIRHLIENKKAKIERAIAQYEKKGFRISLMQNNYPQRIEVDFKSPFGLDLCELILDFDKLVLVAFTASLKNIILKKEYKKIIQSIKHELIRFSVDLHSKRNLLINPSVAGIQRSHWLSVEGDPKKFDELVALVDLMRFLPADDVLCRVAISERSKQSEMGSYANDIKKRLIEVNHSLCERFGLDVGLIDGSVVNHGNDGNDGYEDVDGKDVV